MRVLPQSHIPWLVLSLAGMVHLSACGDSDKPSPGGRAGSGGSEAGASSGGKGGSSGKGSGGASGRGGSGGNGGAGGTGGTGGSSAGTGGAGDAGETGGAGEAGAPSTGGSSGTGAEGGAGGEGGATALSGTTCLSILEENPGASTGVYEIDPDGAGGDAPVSVVCDMDTDGGGWTLGLIKNSMHNGTYATFASGRSSVEALATTPEDASSNDSATPAVAGWIDLNDFPYTNLRLTGYAGGVQTYTSLPIPKSALRISFGQNGYYLYDQIDGYYWCGGEAAYTTNGTGQVSQPSGAPDDCKTHTSLGDGWDFGGESYNTNLTVCGGGSGLMTTGPGSNFVSYTTPGAAQAFWVR